MILAEEGREVAAYLRLAKQTTDPSTSETAAGPRRRLGHARPGARARPRQAGRALALVRGRAATSGASSTASTTA